MLVQSRSRHTDLTLRTDAHHSPQGSFIQDQFKNHLVEPEER